MKLHSLPIVVTLCFCLAWQGCEDDNINPGPFTFPIDLQASTASSNVSLTWTQATVSSFEEYIVIRSIDPIPDTPEPEVTGNQVIIERVDEADENSLIDFATPIVETVYYKVYADVGDRYLMSQTVQAQQDLQLIDYRVDVVEPDPDRNELIGFDRSFDVLFVYDYENKEVKTQRTWSLNNPILRHGSFNGTDEVYVIDQNQSTLYVFRRSDLTLLKQYSTGSIVSDFFFSNGLFFIALSNGTIEVRNRSNYSRLSDRFGAASGTRVLHKTEENGGNVKFVEVAFNAVVNFMWNGSSIQQLESRIDIGGSSQLFTAFHPEHTEMIINNAGRVLAADLGDIGTLGSGLQFHNAMTYSDDGEVVATVGFVGNTNQLLFYSVEQGYPEIMSNELSFTPVKMWGDNGKIYACTVVFSNGGVRSVINMYDLP